MLCVILLQTGRPDGPEYYSIHRYEEKAAICHSRVRQKKAAFSRYLDDGQCSGKKPHETEIEATKGQYLV